MAIRIIVLCKGILEAACGPLSVIRALGTMEINVLCLCSSCRPETKADLAKIGVLVKELAPGEASLKGISGKIRHYCRFRRRAWSVIEDAGPKSLLWVAKIDTAMAMGRPLLKRPYVLTLQELHDKYFLYQRAMRLYASHATAVVVPEYCRANIVRCWHHLTKTPFVLPNKPIPLSRERRLPISDPAAREILASVGPQRRILLYQGGLGPDRDLRPVAKAAAELGDSYRFVILGRPYGDVLPKLREIYPNLVHIPWVRPPTHLEITSHAHLGIVFYNHDALNSIFCAPNKIWEYAAYGVPMICQDIPGLRYTVGLAGAGVCADTNDVSAIVASVRAVDARYANFARDAMLFYESSDTEKIIAQILTSVGFGHRSGTGSTPIRISSPVGRIPDDDGNE